MNSRERRSRTFGCTRPDFLSSSEPLEKSEQEFENAFLRDKGDGEEHS
jgi:hypothetical protein